MFVFNNDDAGVWNEVFDPAKPYSEELNVAPDDFLGTSSGVILSNKDKDLLAYLGVRLSPTLQNDAPVNLLIIISGYLYENSIITDKKVGAYTLIKLKP
jgi:hypothetical protein